MIRQVGVYHKFDIQKKASLYILVNAAPDSAAYRRVLESFSNHQYLLQSSPLWLHGVIHASYFMRWREYIAEYEKRLLPLVSLNQGGVTELIGLTLAGGYNDLNLHQQATESKLRYSWKSEIIGESFPSHSCDPPELRGCRRWT